MMAGFTRTKKIRPQIPAASASIAFRTWLRHLSNRWDAASYTGEVRSALQDCELLGFDDDSLDGCLPTLADTFVFDLGATPPPGPEQRSLSAQIGDRGAYATPPGILASYELALKYASGIRQVATVVRTDHGAPYFVPTADDTANEASIIPENTDPGELDVTLKMTRIDDRKYSSGRIVVPFELLEDAAQAEPFLAQVLAERIGRKQNRDWTAALMLQAVVGRTATSATAISVDDVNALIASIDPAYRANATFLAHPDIALVLRGVKDSSNRPIYLDGEGRQPTVSGFPLVYNLSMDSTVVSGKKTLSFGDHSRLRVRDVREVRIAVMRERFIHNDQVGIQAFHRADAMLIDPGQRAVKYLLHYTP